ncbi:MAG: hypothetical protein C0485_13110 [Pirellula sp.]|nr:hypothetical protein [Pirellula sp.]
MNPKFRHCTSAATVLATLLLCQSDLQAALTRFASRSEWNAAVGAHQTEDFESFTDFTPLPFTGGTFSTSAFNILVDANHGGIGPTNNAGPQYRAPYLNGVYFVGDVHSPETSHPHFNTIVFSTPITAFAATFSALDDHGIDDVRIAGESMKLVPTPSRDGLWSFLGVVSTTPFTTIDIRNANGKLERYGMDDVGFAPVPEPAAITTLAFLAPALAIRRRASLASCQ